MATYILLLTLTPDGREKALADPDYLIHVEQSIHVPGLQTLGVYAVLGQYDFVTIVEAPGNAEIAGFSLELGVKAGAHITTMPVIPAARLESAIESAEAEVALDLPAGRPEVGSTVPI